MKHKRFSIAAFGMAILLAAAVSFSAVMCLADCFSMPCAPVTLLLACIGFSALASTVLALRRSWVITAMAGVIYCAVLYFFRSLLFSGLETAVYCVTSMYALCFDAIDVYGASGGNCTGVLTLLALPLAWITAWVVNREGSALLVALVCAPIFILCLIIVDLAPVTWLIVLTGVLLLLLLTGGVRERDPDQGGKLAWWLLLPTAALISILVALSPPEEYERSNWIDQLQALSEQVIQADQQQDIYLPSDDYAKWISVLKTVDLSKVGPMKRTHIKVLEYTADTAIDYLRGVSLGIYEDNTWSAVPQGRFIAGGFDSEALMTVSAAADASVTVRTVGAGLNLYTPYNMTALPRQGTPVDDAYVDNTANATRYTIEYASGSGYVSPGFTDRTYTNYVNQNYTGVPEGILDELLAIVQREGLDSYADDTAKANAVADYVRSAGVYDLNTPAVPDGEDFVLYFLNESKQGYCVHFASAAAMLLRTLDIPSRYVTGYGVSGPAGETNTVTTDQAHAWVEYYVNGVGWLPLDPTPPDWTLDQPDDPEPDDPTTDEPEPTPEEPEPDEPTPPEEEEPKDPQTPTLSPKPGGSKPALKLSPWLWLLTVPGVLFLIALRRKLLLSQKRKHCSSGHPNRRCLQCWRQLAQVSRITGKRPDEDLISLAEKARFSQHTMTEEEFSLLANAAKEQTDALKQSAGPLKKLWQKYFLVLY